MNTAADSLAEFQGALRDYALYTRREQGPLIEDRARKVRFELFRGFKAIAKTSTGLRAELASLGYRMRRRKAADGGTVTPEQEIRLRVRSLRFLSVSFLIKGWQARDRGQQARFTAVNRAGVAIGGAYVDTAVGRETPFVSLTSLLSGVVEQNEQRDIVGAALSAQARDMAAYLQRKHDERLRKLFGGALQNATAAIT